MKKLKNKSKKEYKKPAAKAESLEFFCRANF